MSSFQKQTAHGIQQGIQQGRANLQQTGVVNENILGQAALNQQQGLLNQQSLLNQGSLAQQTGFVQQPGLVQQTGFVQQSGFVQQNQLSTASIQTTTLIANEPKTVISQQQRIAANIPITTEKHVTVEYVPVIHEELVTRVPVVTGQAVHTGQAIAGQAYVQEVNKEIVTQEAATKIDLIPEVSTQLGAQQVVNVASAGQAQLIGKANVISTQQVVQNVPVVQEKIVQETVNVPVTRERIVEEVVNVPVTGTVVTGAQQFQNQTLLNQNFQNQTLLNQNLQQQPLLSQNLQQPFQQRNVANPSLGQPFKKF